MTATLNIVGAGQVGCVLGRLFAAQGVFVVRDVLTRSPASAKDVVRFIGAGRALGASSELRPATAWMLAVGDDQIVPVCAAPGRPPTCTR